MTEGRAVHRIRAPGRGPSQSEVQHLRSPRAVLTAMVLAILGLLAVVAPSASAITGGEPDGNRHPNVGLILFYDQDGRFRCSATLVTPTVLLTAGHCTDGTLG